MTSPSYKLTDGTTEYEVVYNSSTQPDYKAYYGTTISQLEPAILNHTPDDGPQLPVRAWDTNRTVFLTMDVLGSDWDEIYNDIHEIKRFVAGAHSQALKYWLNERNENRVVLRMQLDGATSFTDFPVLWGFVDDSGAYYTGSADLRTRGRGLVIALTVTPYGEGALQSARNNLQNAMPYIFTAGLADGWAKAGSLTVSEDTAIKLIGGSSQKTTSTAAASWIRTPTVPGVGGNTEAGAFVWVYSDDSFTYDFQLYGSVSGAIGSPVTLVYATPTAASKSLTDSEGRVWYRIDITESISSGENVYLEITHNNSSGDLWINCPYILLASSAVTLPDFWCSGDDIENRGDIDATNLTELNWIDVGLIAGDAPALVRLEMETSGLGGGGYGLMYTSRWRDTMYNAGDLSGFAHWVEDSSLTNTGAGGGTYSTVVDGTTTAGQYARYAEAGAGSTTGFWRYTVASADVPNFFQWPRRVYLRARASVTGAAFALKSSNIVPQITEARNPQAANTWELIDIGLINGVGIDNFDYTTIGGAAIDVDIDIEFVTAATQDTVEIDAIYFAPASPDGFMIADGDIGGFIAIFPFRERVGVEDRLYPDILGGTWTAIPGPKLTRSSFVLTDDNSAWDITDGLQNVDVLIKPRSYHLLGTQ